MIYHVFANRSNIGDWLSAKGIQHLLSGREFTECYCDEPFVEETAAILSGATANDLVIIGGGGLLMDYFLPFWKSFRPIADRVPFVIWGIGCCDIKHEDSLPPAGLIEEIVSKARYCFVRDELSRNYLSNCELPAPALCPSLNVVKPIAAPGNGILHVVNYTTVGADAYEVMCATAEKFALEKGIEYRETNNLIKKGSETELARVLSLYAQSSIVLSSALHGCIIGVAMGLKVLAVSGDRKIDAFMQAIGLQDWVLDYTEADAVAEKLKLVYQQTWPENQLGIFQRVNKSIARHVLSINNVDCFANP